MKKKDVDKKKCLMCERRKINGQLYCSDHYQEMLAAKSDQTYSASDDMEPWEYDN